MKASLGAVAARPAGYAKKVAHPDLQGAVIGEWALGSPEGARALTCKISPQPRMERFSSSSSSARGLNGRWQHSSTFSTLRPETGLRPAPPAS
jgi:hypothetical protein